jgi:hypothetical protein
VDPDYRLVDNWYTACDYEMYFQTNDAIAEYLDTINWDYWEEYYNKISEAEEKQE